MMLAGHLPDGVENGLLNNACCILRPHDAPEASATIARLGEKLAPFVLSSEQGDHLVVAEPDRQCPAVLLRGALGHAKATRPWASRSCRASGNRNGSSS